jgi:hypothetical protein
VKVKDVTVEAELDLAAAKAAEKGAVVVTEEVMGAAMAAVLVEAKDAAGLAEGGKEEEWEDSVAG